MFKKIFRIFYPIVIYTGITYIIMVGIIVCALVLGAFQAIRAQSDWNVMRDSVLAMLERQALLFTVIGGILTIPVLFYFFQKDQKQRGISPALPPLQHTVPVYLVLLGISTCIFGNHLIDMSGIARYAPSYEAVAQDLYSTPLWLQIAGMGFIIPIVEELTFRGLVFRRLRDWMGFFFATVLSSLIFAIFHGNLVQGIYACFLAFLMAYVYEKTGSLWAAMLFHMAANLTSVVMTVEVVNQILYKSGWTMSVMTVLSLLLFLWSLRKLAYKEEEMK